MRYEPTLYQTTPHPSHEHSHLRIAPAEVTAYPHRQRQSKPPPRRGEIRGWSESSRKRLQWVLRNTVGMWHTMVTLTYQEPPEPKAAKHHLNAFLQGLRRREIDYCWALELQQRGAIHFHIYTSVTWLPLADLRASWMNLTGNPSQSINVVPVHNPFYILKYIAKSEGSPDALGRYWGTSVRVPTATLFAPAALVRVLRKYAERVTQRQPDHAVYLPCSLLSPETLHRLLEYYGLADARPDAVAMPGGSSHPPPGAVWPPRELPEGHPPICGEFTY